LFSSPLERKKGKKKDERVRTRPRLLFFLSSSRSKAHLLNVALHHIDVLLSFTKLDVLESDGVSKLLGDTCERREERRVSSSRATRQRRVRPEMDNSPHCSV